MYNSVSIFVDNSLGDGPLPVLLVRWGADSDEADHFGPELFRTLKRILSPSRTWESAGHRWSPHVWRTEKIKATLSYRDAEDGEYLTCSVHCPDLYRGAGDVTPHHNPPAFIEAARMTAADRVWWDWKAAYQHTKYYLFAYGTPKNWRHYLATVPAFLLTELDFSEIGPWSKISEETEAARRRSEGGISV